MPSLRYVSQELPFTLAPSTTHKISLKLGHPFW